MKTYLLFLALLAASLTLIPGCRDKDVIPVKSEGPGRGSIQIVLPRDTLSFLRGDSTSLSGYVILRNGDGQFAPGARIVLSTTSLTLGIIQFPMGTDTTDGLGRVYFRYCAVGYGGSDTILAQCNEVEIRRVITLIAITYDRPSRGITIVPDTLYVYNQWQEDSALVTICPDLIYALRDGFGNITFPLQATGGRLSQCSPVDCTDCYHAYWFPSHAAPGRYCLGVRVGPAADSACVVVIDTIGRMDP